MKKSKKMCLLFSCLLLLAFASLPREADAANVVTKKISEIKKVYPQGSRINKWVVAPSIVNKNGDVYYSSIYNGGCNALVAYVTMKVFHNPYVPYSTSYKTIGTAKTSSPSAMNKLFKKAKPGDVVRMFNGSGECHFAIFLSKTGSGIKLYEANFGFKNKVWYNHLWKWGNIKSWSHGATKISVCRSNNYKQVAAGKAAKNYKKGDTFTIRGITYRVIKNKTGEGQVKVIARGPDAGTTPKAIGINKDTASRLRSAENLPYRLEFVADMLEYKAYQILPDKIQDEQYFVVK